MWITLTRAKLQDKLTGAEYNAVKGAALGAGQDADNLIDEALARVTKEVRGYVGGCKSNTLGATGTIPDELEDAALAMALVRFFNRVPNLKSLLSSTRLEAEKNAVELMKQVALCRFGIVPPETPAAGNEQTQPSKIGVVGKRTKISRDSLNGMW